MMHHARDLWFDQRIRPARIPHDAPTGDERTRAFGAYLYSLDALADRVKDIPEAEIDAAIDEALSAVRRDSLGLTSRE